ncbi:zinc finger and BTB domain-containing protein 17 isoform X2 [Bombyx mori]|uniref:Uncharacterized protein n=1 Tax=Bombyx mori TaxID=7091 RepID=A0A8R2ARA8_BOMMO|nr:zinc finger and BTB domain-containing protein 17 isoform X2 [Bombyx mori]
MRKYTRRKPESELIVDALDLCRLCLQKPQEAIPIFEGTNNICGTLSLRIMMCVGLELTHENCLPNVICTGCFEELNRCYTFRKKCEVSYQKLKSHLQAVKEKECLNQTMQQAVKDDVNLNKNVINNHINKDNGYAVLSHDQLTSDLQICNGVIEVNSDATMNEQSIFQDGKRFGETDDVLQEARNTEITPDISSFLSTLLVQVGVLSQQDDMYVFMDSSINNLQLSTGDGKTVSLELVEEDEEEKEPVKETDPVLNEENTNVITSTDTANVSQPLNQKLPSSENQSKGQGAWCGACGKRLSSRGALRRHAHVHTVERPHACSVCGRTFAQRSVLQRHKLVHLEQRPFQCEWCAKSFTQRSALAAHRRAHEPPHARALHLHRCAHCTKLFLHSSSLSRHMLTHSGRVYECGGCGRQFNDKSSLLRHLKTASHRDQPAAT